MYAQDNILCQFGPKICPSVQQLISQPILIHFWWELYHDDLISYNQLMEYLEEETDTGPLEDGFYRFKCIKDHKGTYTSSEVDLGGHDPNPNHVNESLLSEVDWGAHDPDADDPEQLTGESIQSFLTFVVQLQWLVALGRLVTHAQTTTLSKLVVASS